MTTADDHREIAATFTARAREVAPAAWDNPAPVEGWAARDVVRHLVEWLPDFLVGAGGPALPSGPSVDDDPVGAWECQADAVQTLLDDPATAGLVLHNVHIGEMTLDQALAMIYVNDVFMHTWDLCRATGLDETLDPVRCAELVTGMEPLDEMLRASGQYGPRVPVPHDADAQTKLIAFIGRNP